jgi:hypothetical protein
MLKLGFILSSICIILIVTFVFFSNLLTPAPEQFDIDTKMPESVLDLDLLPDHRFFKMGFTNQPFDWNESAFQKTTDLIKQHADTITIFFDGNVPWVEAYAEEPYSAALEADLRRQQATAREFEHVVVMASFLGGDRVSLAGYAGGKTGTEERSGIWAKLDFNDPQVIAAYFNHSRNLIERFQPEYFGYVAEVDAVFTDVKDDRFQKLRNMAKKVYTNLKAEYPGLSVFAEFTLGDRSYMETRKEVIAALLPYSDLYALSTYPAQYEIVAGDASKLPDTWFEQAKQYASGKPIAILETGFIAEPFMHPTLGVKLPGKDKRLLIPGGEKSQALYTKKLLQAAQDLDMEFVNLWAIHDLDALFVKLEASGGPLAEPMWQLAKDIGLYDQDSNPRPALRIWDAWFKIPLGNR